MKNFLIPQSPQASDYPQIPKELHKSYSWFVLGILIAIVLISVPFLPSIMRNLKSNVLTLEDITISSQNAEISNASKIDATSGKFDVAFNTVGQSTIEVALSGEKGTVTVDVEEPLQPITNNQKPVTNNQQPETSNQQPVTSSQPGGMSEGLIGLQEASERARQLALTPTSELEILKQSADIPEYPFKDINEQTQYNNSILKVFELGLMTGTESPIGQVFNPTSLMDRAQFAVVFLRLQKYRTIQSVEPRKKEECSFLDLEQEKEKWYYQEVMDACLQRIVEGFPDQFFKPFDFINYAEAISVVIRTVSQFDDSVLKELDRQTNADLMTQDTERKWYDKYIDTAVNVGILTKEAKKEMDDKQAWAEAKRDWIADIIAHIPNLEL